MMSPLSRTGARAGTPALLLALATVLAGTTSSAVAAEPPAAEPAAEAAAEEVREELAAMSQIKIAYGPIFAPAADRFSFVTTLSGQAQLWTVAADGGWPVQLTGHDDGVMVAEWSPAGDLIAFTVPPDGGGNGQIHLIEPRAGATHRRITDGGHETNWLSVWGPEGRYLYYASNRRDPGVMDVYRYDVRSGEHRLLAETDGMAGIQDVSRDGRLATLWVSSQRSDDRFYVLDLATGARHPILPDLEPGTMDGGKLSADGRHIYLSTDRGRDFNVFGRVPVDAEGLPGELEVLAARDGVPLADFELSADRSTVALIWNVGGRSELWLAEAATMERLETPELPSEVMLDRALSADGSRLVFVMTGAAAPLDIWVLDVASRTLRQVTHMPHPGIDLDRFVRPELVRYVSHDGLEVTGWLYRSRGADGPGPVAVSIHGGPELQERPIFQSLYQGLLARGISVFAPNVRGSAGFGKRFMALDDGARRTDAIRDVEVGVRHLIETGVADPERIGIFGFSYGGFVTLSAIADTPELYAAAASVSGIVNFETFFANTEPWIAAVSRVEYGDPATQMDLLRRLSPVHRLEEARVPLFLAHGANDNNVPVTETDQIVEAWKARGLSVEYLRFDGEGHAIRRQANRLAYETGIVLWFDRYLNGAPPASEPAAVEAAAEP